MSGFSYATNFRQLVAPILILSALFLCSCVKDSEAQASWDHAADALPFPRPKLDPLHTLPGVAPLPAEAQHVLDIRRAFFAGDFARVDSTLNEAHQRYLDGRLRRSGTRAISASIQETQLAGIDACSDWLKAMPTSYAAHWLCGAVWQSGAFAIRTGKVSSEVRPIQFRLMRERMQRSNALLEKALTLTDQPLEALALLGANHYSLGNEEQAEAYLQRAETIKPAHLGIHSVRLQYVQPEWGGSQTEVLKAMERARAAGLEASDLLDLEDEFIARPWRMSTPGAARIYWEEAIRKQPTSQRLLDLTKHFVWLSNWHDALPYATRLVETYPERAEGHYLRARINANLGYIPEAREDYRMAAALGHDLALQELIMAHIRGGLGLPAKSFKDTMPLCRYGASLASAVGANCMGSMYDEAASVGLPLRRDIPQSFAWHLLGARAGHYNSQYDLGWLLYTGRGPNVKPEMAASSGVFWMRRAAEQDHRFAKQKLEEREIPLSEELPSKSSHLDTVLNVLYGLIQILL